MTTIVEVVRSRTNGLQPDQPAATSFNRPPRTRPQLPTDVVRLPELPKADRQMRGWNIISSLLTSGALIGASYLVYMTRGGSLIYLVPMVAGAAIFLLLSIVQLLHDYWRRWQESVKYTAMLKVTMLRLIQLYTDQQYIRYTIDPELTVADAAERIALCDKEQSDLIVRFVPRTFSQRVLRRVLTPTQLGLQTFNDRWTHPQSQAAALLEIAGCPTIAGKRMMPRPRLWERRPSDPDFLSLRLGVSEQPATITIEALTGVEHPAHITALIEHFASVRNVPLTLALPQIGALGVAGPRELALPLAHALLWQVVTHHAPSEVRIAAIYRMDRRATWAWLSWLPHTIALNGDRRRRMLAVNDHQIEQLLIALLDELSRRRDRTDEDLRPPQIVLLIDDDQSLQQRTVVKEIMRRGKVYGINVIALVDTWEQVPGDCGATLRIDADGKGSYACAGGEWSRSFATTAADQSRSEQLSRALAPLVLTEMGGSQEIPRNVRLLDLLRSRSTAEFDPAQLWKRDIVDAWHPDVPIGRAEGGKPVYLDLRQFYDGPHGIIAGKTGAGKSELLQTIITALAATHTPDRTQFMLIDFKGGAALRDFGDLPHTVGLVTDLQDSRLAERAIIAMKSELKRRKDLLNQKKVPDIIAYRALQPRPAPIANLLIIIDEFDTMVKEQPGFVTELITVVKQGRSLGVHLLVASQEPSNAVKDEIKRQLQFWIALRLGSVQDSREMLERPDAFFLPPDIPGRAYKRVGTQIQPFQAARVSALFQPLGDDDQEVIIDRDPATGAALAQQRANRQRSASYDGRPYTDLRFIIDLIKSAGSAYETTQIWCPPLPARLTLSEELRPNIQVLPPDIVASTHERCWWSTRRPKRLAVPIGLLDIPQESRQDIAEVDLNAGHVLVIGAPGSGKTMLLRTLLLSLALTHQPSEVWCYIIDAGGQGLGAFKRMPHIGGLVQVREVDQVRRVIWMVQRALKEREQAQRTAEQTSDRSLPAILLMIDKFALFREEYENLGLIDDLIALAGQGRAYDIHLIITADRPGDVPYKLQGLFDIRLLLRLTDESDALTMTGRREAAHIPLDRPGRGYRLLGDQGWLEFQIALPYLTAADEQLPAETVNTLLDSEIVAKARMWMEAMAAAWNQLPAARHESPPPIRLLPEQVAFANLWQQAEEPGMGRPGANAGLDVLVGLEAQALGLARFTLTEAAASILVVGGFQAGKTTALRTMLRSLAIRYQPDQIVFVLVDPRRSSFRDLPIHPHQPLYATTEPHLAELAERLERALEDETEQRHWVICIDDFEVGQSQFSTQFQKPFSTQKTFMVVLEKLANVGRERGFSLILSTNTTTPTQLLGQLSASRHGLVLQPHNYPPATNLLGVRLPIPLSGNQGVPGRGLMVVNNLQQWVQVASDGE